MAASDPIEQQAVDSTEEAASEKVEATIARAPEAVANTQKKDKFSVAKAKLEEAKSSIAQTDDAVEICLKKIDDDLASFKQAHTRLKEHTLKPTRALMEELGVDERIIEAHVASPVVEASDPSIAPVNVPVISKGVFKGFMIALLGMVIAFVAWCYAATQALGLPPIPEKFPDIQRLNKAFAWTAQQLGQGENVAMGSATVVVAAILLGMTLFWLTRFLRDSRNLKVAQKIEEDTEFYCTKKSECKQQMEKIREHIAHAQKTVETYTVLLDELKARLARARFIEEPDTFGALHAKTQKDIEAANKLIAEVTAFLKTPMAQSGVLNKEGIDALEKATGEANRYVMELYA